jgi:hypothetical protein
MSRRRSGLSDAMLLWVIGGVLGLGIVILLIVWFSAPSGPSRPLKDFTLHWTMTPTFRTVGQDSDSDSRKENPAVVIHLDISHPMGGFLPPAGSKATPGFRPFVSTIAEHLVRVAGGTASPLDWYAVAEGRPQKMVSRPELIDRQALFTGSESRLDESIAWILGRLESGEVAAAALITDLNATEELTGAMGAAKALSDWLENPRVRQGELHLGIFSARAEYWGRTSTACRGNGEIGCWYSEQAKTYKPMTQLARVPLYVLILGKGRENLEDLGTSLLKDASGVNLEDPKWVLLTAASGPRTERSDCRASKAGSPKEDQFALARDEENRYRCLRSEKVEINCPLPWSEELKPTGIRTSWQAVSAEIVSHDVVMTVDCDALDDNPPEGDLTIELAGELTGKIQGAWWEEWSKPSDEFEETLHQTLGLKNFVEKVLLIPDQVTVVSDPILHTSSGS